MKGVFSLAAAVACACTLNAQQVRTLESSRLMRDVTPVSIRLVLGTGKLSIGASESQYLYRSIARFGDAYVAPVSNWNASQRVLTLTAGQRIGGPNAGNETASDEATMQDWRVQLTKRAPLELTINASAADATLDLTGLPLRRFSLNTGAARALVRFDAPNAESMSLFDATVGAGGMQVIGLGNAASSEARISGDVGEISLDLGGRWQRDMQIEVRSAVGNVKITAPPTIGVELQTPGILSRTDVSGAFTKAAGVWRSANFSSASVKVRVVVRTMLGKVELVQR